MVVVCPFITQHEAPTVIHSLLRQTVEDLTFSQWFLCGHVLDKDIKLLLSKKKQKQKKKEQEKKIAYTQKFTANITHKNKAVSTNNSKLSKK